MIRILTTDTAQLCIEACLVAWPRLVRAAANTNDQFAAVARGDGGWALPRPADHRPAGSVTPAGTTALAEQTPPGALGQRPLSPFHSNLINQEAQ